MRANYSAIKEEFDGKARDYDELHCRSDCIMGVNERSRRRGLTELVQGNGHLLSLGCGTGWCLDHFSRRGYSCIGVDISFEMLKQCAQRNVTVCHAYAERLPIKSMAFEHVLCSNMFQYVKDPLSFLLEVKRVMNDKGVLVFDFKNFLSLRSAGHYFIRLFRAKHGSDKEKRYTIFKIRRLAKQAGFEINQTRGMEFHWFQTSLNPKHKILIKAVEVGEDLLSKTPLKFLSGRLMVSSTKMETDRLAG